MSERTTIGGTVYESVGSSSSNLLLKCNGTARIQWGGKLIDLIKNGKIASESSSLDIGIVSDASEIKSDGIYVLNTEKSSQLWICKNGKTYNITETDLYISASTKQDITVEQQKQALENIGIYYNTLNELNQSGIQNGLVYVLENSTLYTIINGVISEFEAKLKTVTVEQNDEYGDIINGSVELVLSVDNDEYLILKDNRITVNKSIHAKDYVQIGSEGADLYNGYRLYVDGDTSCLDVDKINVRNGLPSQEYIEVTFERLQMLINTEELQEHRWYLITDFQNHWRLPAKSTLINRPILVKALTKNKLYKEGLLFKNQDVKIQFDVTFTPTIRYEVTPGVYETVTARGRIVWMKDMFNNEANFDFLDYYDYFGNAITTLHTLYEGSEDKSIFPKNSFNNKLTAYDLKGITLIESDKEEVYELAQDNTTIIDFAINDSDSDSETMIMCDNIIVCRNLVVSPTCTVFKGNKLSQCVNLRIENTFENNTIDSVFYKSNLEIVYYTDEEFKELSRFTEFEETVFNGKIKNLKATKISNCKFYKDIINCVLGTIVNTEFEETIEDSSIDEIIRHDVNYFYKLPKLTNTSILEISNDVVFLGEIKNTTIDKLTNKVVINNISDCCIGEIKDNTIINGDLVNITIKEIVNSTIDGSIQNSIFDSIKDTTVSGTILDSTINSVYNSDITGTIIKGSCGNVEGSYITAELYNVSFKNLTNCTFSGDTITDVTSFYDLFSFDSNDYDLLYVSEKVKEIYLVKGEPKVLFIPDVVFQRGMIIMHSGIVDIPEGWAICDGKEYTFNGITSRTPNLINKFIKSSDGFIVGSDSVGDNDDTIDPNLTEDNKLKLKKEHLPEHRHPHLEHTHSMGTASSNYVEEEDYSYTDYIGDETKTEYDTSYYNTSVSHTHNIDGAISKEDTSVIFENEAFSIEPHAYKLIFIMKL